MPEIQSDKAIPTWGSPLPGTLVCIKLIKFDHKEEEIWRWIKNGLECVVNKQTKKDNLYLGFKDRH